MDFHGIVYIHGAQRINPIGFGVPLSFHVTPPAGQNFNFSCEIPQYLLDVLAQDVVQTLTVPRG